ncbi:MAG: phenazine biosynthesis protein PhzA/PhzB [Ilumatobacteraceae bacterium]|nr:phenazine biosynthesis protein PhzA/PhzB [Ilumatobacteraceae bacterium]
MNPVVDEDREDTQRLVNEYLRLFSEQRWNEWIELWAEDGVLEFPFAPAGRRCRYVGKDEILAYMQPLGGRMQIDQLEYFDVHPMLDSAVYCFEMGFTGHIVETGAAYDQKYISIIETKDGKIWRYREYWNPIVSIDANGGREAWTAAFGSPAEAGGS